MTRWAAITADEFELLGGLPHQQRALYMVLLWYVDQRTGRVGERRGISLLGLQEELEVHPLRGRHADQAGKPTKKSVISALAGLQKSGLIVPCGNGEVLVFSLPKCRRVSARPRDEGHMRKGDDGARYQQAKTPLNQSFASDVEGDEGGMMKPHEGHTSRVRINPISVESSSTSERAVDNFSAPSMSTPMSGVELAGLVVWLERKRGKIARVLATDPEVMRWAEASVTGLELSEAHRLAVDNRRSSGDQTAVNAGFLDSILRSRILNRRAVCRREATPRAMPWQMTPAGIEAMGQRHGIERKPGESDAALRSRVELAVVLAEDAAKQAQRTERPASRAAL